MPGSSRANRPAPPNNAMIRRRSLFANTFTRSTHTSQSWTSPRSVCTRFTAATASSIDAP